MNTFKKIIFKKRFFFISLLLLFFTCMLSLIVWGKPITFLWLNNFHTYWLDKFFIYYTNVGDGFFTLTLGFILVFIFRKRKMGVALLLAFALSGILAQLIKALILAPRPKLFFAPKQLPFFINDIILESMSSFPSGHTATAFAMATVLIVFIKNNVWHLPILSAAILVGYSRIYLSQHFLGDVLAGAFLGIAVGIICSWMVLKSNRPFLNQY